MGSAKSNAWPGMARAVDQAGNALRARYGTSPIPAEEIRREAERIGGYRPGSVIPSDYCYNLVNRARISLTHAVLVRVGRGLYRYVGPGYAYTGPVMWRPKGGSERQVGSWTEGKCRMTEDPRGGAAA